MADAHDLSDQLLLALYRFAKHSEKTFVEFRKIRFAEDSGYRGFEGNLLQRLRTRGLVETRHPEPEDQLFGLVTGSLLSRLTQGPQQYQISLSGIDYVNEELAREDSYLSQFVSSGLPALVEIFPRVVRARPAKVETTNRVEQIPESEAESIPAADRVVSLDHNQPPLIAIREASEDLRQKIARGNDLGDLTIEQAEAAAAEIYQLEQMLGAPFARPQAVMEFARQSLRWIADKAGGAVVGAAALAVLTLIAAYFGLAT